MVPNIKSFYASVLSQAFSPCESFLAAGSNFGHINIFNIKKLYEHNDGQMVQANQWTSPLRNFSASTKPIQGMVSSSTHLIVGGKNRILGYSWDKLISSKNNGKDPEPDWSADLHLPMDFGTKETVDGIIMGEDSSIFVACGDNSVRQLDLEYGKVKSTLTGHTDFIHSLSYAGNQLATASEDGSVSVWDVRKSKPVHTITPHSNPKLNRPQLGKWIGAVAMNEDWLVCGGGPRLALYHLRSLTMTRSLLDDDRHGINNAIFHEDSIIVGMDGPLVYHVLFSGDVTVQMPTTPLRVYSLCLQKEDENQLLTVGGASGDIDLCAGSKLQDQIVHCVS